MVLKTKKNQLIFILFLTSLFLGILGINTKVEAVKKDIPVSRIMTVTEGETKILVEVQSANIAVLAKTTIMASTTSNIFVLNSSYADGITINRNGDLFNCSKITVKANKKGTYDILVTYVYHNQFGQQTGTKMEKVRVTVKEKSKPAETQQKPTTQTKPTQVVKTFTVKFNANNGTGSMGSQYVTHGDYNKNKLTKLEKNKFTRNGYTFKGWYAKRSTDGFWRGYDKNGKEGWYKTPSKYYLYKDKEGVARTVAPGASVTMYAQWEKKEEIKNDNNNNSNPGAYTKNLKTEKTLKIKSGSSWWTYSKHTSSELSSGKRYLALRGNDVVKIKAIEGNWLKVEIVSLSSAISKKNFKVGDVYYIYYGSTASKYITQM